MKREILYVIKKKERPLYIDNNGYPDLIRYARFMELDEAFEYYDDMINKEHYEVTQVVLSYFEYL